MGSGKLANLHSRQHATASPDEDYLRAGIPLADNKEKLMSTEPAFMTDKDVARFLGLSPSWVRGQRHKRRNGIPHILNIDARYIGSCPRYLKSEIDAFVATIAA